MEPLPLLNILSARDLSKEERWEGAAVADASTDACLEREPDIECFDGSW